MVYRKYGKKDLVNAIANMNLTESNDKPPELTEKEKEDALLFLRTCIVDRDLMVLKTKLEQTIEIREEMIKKKKGIKFYVEFPFYFVNPELVRIYWG